MAFVNRLQDFQFPSFLLFKLLGFDSYPGGTHLPLFMPAFAGRTLPVPYATPGMADQPVQVNCGAKRRSVGKNPRLRDWYHCAYSLNSRYDTFVLCSVTYRLPSYRRRSNIYLQLALRPPPG